jgi:hypothetical protein
MDADHSTAIAQANQATESAAASTASRILSGEQAQNSVEQKHFKWTPEDFVCKEKSVRHKSIVSPARSCGGADAYSKIKPASRQVPESGALSSV